MHDERRFSRFVILWLTQSLSRLGSSLTPFALILWAYGETGSALGTSMLTVSSYIPYILFSMPVGVLTDRISKKRLMLIADTAAAIGTILILLLWRTGSLELWQLYLINAFSGLMQTFQAPAADVAITLVTPPDKYQKAGALKEFSSSVISMASPVIAAALYGIGGLGLVIAVDIATFSAAFISLLFFVRIPLMETSAERISAIENLEDGLLFLKRNVGILEVMMFLSAINFVASIYNAALPAMVLSFQNPGVLAAVNSTAGIAMVLGSVISAALPAPKSRVKLIIASLFVAMSTENFFLAFSRSPIAWCIGAFLGWMCIPLMNTNLDALMRSSIPASMQGRVYSARNMLQFFTIPLGYIAGGILVDNVMEPFMAGSSSEILAILFGEGKGSGAAFLFFAIGLMGVLVCIIFSRMKAMKALDN